MFSLTTDLYCNKWTSRQRYAKSHRNLEIQLTFLGFSMVLGFAMSRDASRIASLFVVRSNILKKLLYDPVIIAESLPFQQHSNLSKMQSFSYNEHSFERRYSCTCNTRLKIPVITEVLKKIQQYTMLFIF